MSEHEKGIADKAYLPLRTHNVGGIAGEQLLSVIERVERLNEEKAGLAADIQGVFAEAKGSGFDVKALREILKLRKQDVAEREEHEHIVSLYQRALGMQPDLFEEGGES